MRVVLADKLMKLLGIKDYQLMYKVEEQIVADVNDYTIIQMAQKRDLMDTPKCKKCKRNMEATFSFNGVLDSWTCPKEDFFGKHK